MPQALVVVLDWQRPALAVVVRVVQLDLAVAVTLVEHQVVVVEEVIMDLQRKELLLPVDMVAARIALLKEALVVNDLQHLDQVEVEVVVVPQLVLNSHRLQFYRMRMLTMATAATSLATKRRTELKPRNRAR